eukprot:11939360-Ditylum_brightwellii.AAC.1
MPVEDVNKKDEDEDADSLSIISSDESWVTTASKCSFGGPQVEEVANLLLPLTECPMTKLSRHQS